MAFTTRLKILVAIVANFEPLTYAIKDNREIPNAVVKTPCEIAVAAITTPYAPTANAIFPKLLTNNPKPLNNNATPSTINVIAGASFSSKLIMKPSAADDASSKEPFKESRITSANSFAVPSAFTNSVFKLETSSTPDAIVANAVTALLSVRFNISSTLTPLSNKSFNAGNNVSTELTPSPNS